MTTKAFPTFYNKEGTDITNQVLADYSTYSAIKTDVDTAVYGVNNELMAATVYFDTELQLYYYYDVELTVPGTIEKAGIIITDTALESPTGEYTDSDNLLLWQESNHAVAKYMSVTDKMSINETADMYATLYVVYKDANEEIHYVYGDTMQYGIERYLKKQIYEYCPESLGGNGQKVKKQTADGYETEQYVNLLVKILKANESAKALEALRSPANE
jgi:hypothetical protein